MENRIDMHIVKQRLLHVLAGVVMVSGIAGCAPKDAGTVDLKSEEDLPGLTVSTSAGNYFDTKYSGRKDIYTAFHGTLHSNFSADKGISDRNRFIV